MSNNHFDFKKFTIHQNKCSMKVGTDGVLLGAWTDINNAKKILDVGAGTALIAIMLAQRSNANIEGVEIDGVSYKQAVENVDNCAWKDRIKLHHTSFQSFYSNTNAKFDLIVSNPPFFINSLKSVDNSRNFARHDQGLSHNQLLQGSSMIIAPNGKLSVIMPYNEGCKLISDAAKFNLFCLRKTFVRAKPGGHVKRMLIEFSKIPAPCSENNMDIENASGGYSDSYKKITKDFYLAF